MKQNFTQHRHQHFVWAILLVNLLLSAGCSLLPGQEGTPTTEATATPQTAAVFPTQTTAPSPTPQPTNTPEPTPIVAAIVASSQSVSEDGVLVIDQASLPEPGWLTIFSQDGDANGELLGYVDLPAGVHRDIQVTIDPFQATDTLIAELHSNLGDLQELEIPDTDVIMSDEARAEFAVEIILPQASIVINDQEVSADGNISINSVRVLEPTWVVIHADDDGSAGAVLGQVLLDTGENEDVSLTIRWQQGTPTLHAVLHEDSGEPGYLDFPSADQPLVANGEAIAAPFSATYPPDVLVYDQPVLDSQVVIERVISNGPGWLVVQFDDDGQPGLIIGHAPLEDGLNEQVEVELLDSALTETLFVRIHQDTTPGDVFSFPGSDPAVMFEGRLPQAQSFRTSAGSYIIVHDQSIGDESTVSASVVIATGDAWLVIQADDNGVPGVILGHSFVPAGVNRDVAVSLDSAPSSDRLHAVLYQDAGEAEVFEAPDGPDASFRVQGGTVQVPFQVLPTID